MTGRAGWRWAVRLVILGVAVFLILGGPLPTALGGLVPDRLRRVVPAFSPLVAFCEALAQKQWYVLTFHILPPVFVLAMGVWRGRWFCRWVCPAGTMHSLAGAVRLGWARPTLIKRRIAPYLFYIIVFSSLCGLPSLLWLDPLSSFSRLAGAGRSLAAWVYGGLIPIFLLLGLIQPVIWCSHFCPLGYLFDLSRSLRRSPKQTFMADRRRILVGLAVGVPAATVLPRLLRRSSPEILPPGGGDSRRFAAACTRCYACVAACPAKIIQVKTGGEFAELFMPVVDLKAGEQHCLEDCNACTQVCPTGAIRQLTLDLKQQTQIARARVRRSACIAWDDNEVCMVCDEYCPYNAIDAVYRPSDTYHDVPLPIISPQRCRGCGYCRVACVSEHPDKAIDIRPIARQSRAIQAVDEPVARADRNVT